MKIYDQTSTLGTFNISIRAYTGGIAGELEGNQVEIDSTPRGVLGNLRLHYGSGLDAWMFLSTRRRQ